MRAKTLLARIDLSTVINRIKITLEDLQTNHPKRTDLIDTTRESLTQLTNVKEVFNDLEQINEELYKENSKLLLEALKHQKELKLLRNFKNNNIDKLTNGF